MRSMEEELGRAQSKPTVRPAFDSNRTRLGKGLRPRSKVFLSLGFNVGAARPPFYSPRTHFLLNG